jgi:hypothetical protein
MAFASGPALASGEEMDSVTTDETLDSSTTWLEPGDAGMGAGNSKVSNEGHAAPYYCSTTVVAIATHRLRPKVSI